MNGKGERERLGPAAGVCLHTGPVVPHFLRSQQAQPAETALVLSVPAVAATAAASGYHPAGRDKMKWKALVMAAILQAQLPVTGKADGRVAVWRLFVHVRVPGADGGGLVRSWGSPASPVLPHRRAAEQRGSSSTLAPASLQPSRASGQGQLLETHRPEG